VACHLLDVSLFFFGEAVERYALCAHRAVFAVAGKELDAAGAILRNGGALRGCRAACRFFRAARDMKISPFCFDANTMSKQTKFPVVFCMIAKGKRLCYAILSGSPAQKCP
jgi:hypothetical protein